MACGSGAENAPLPQGTTIQDVYDAQQGALLILGQPGSGKTTLLLELTATLLDQAKQDETYPIPVVSNLATWTKQHTLASWLIAQMHDEYDVPRKIGQAWVDAGVVLPLLDGLDELTEARRAAGVDAINAYRREHEATWAASIVVCCRSAEYETLPPLRLYGAIVVQPLTRPEINTYLHDGGLALAVGFIFGFGGEILFGHLGRLVFGLGGGLFFGLGGGLIDFKPVEAVRWNWRHLTARSNLSGALVGGLVLAIALGWNSGLINTLGIGLGSTLVTWSLGGLVNGLEARVNEQRGGPNEGIRRSIKWALGVASIGVLGTTLIGGLVSVLLSVLGVRLEGRSGSGPGFILAFALVLGLAFGLVYGGAAVVKHYTRRRRLWLSGIFPWNITVFLDSCAARGLVQRGGGGWRFPHNLIRDHFAELEVKEEGQHQTS